MAAITQSLQGLDPDAHRAAEVFERYVRPKLVPADEGKFLAIDLQSGDFQIHEDDYEAVTQLRTRRPSGDIWLMQSDGSPACFLGYGQ
jgi:hypothetical protein